MFNKAQQNNAKVIEFKQYPHHEDRYLYLVLAVRYEGTPNEEYVTWVWNENSQGFNYGRYYATKEVAQQQFIERYNELPKSN